VTFEQDKAKKLKRLPALRVMNALGMMRWDLSEYGTAEQRLRLLHPLTWPYLVAVVVYGVLMYGIPETWYSLRQDIETDTVMW
jgi:hypothetical protein